MQMRSDPLEGGQDPVCPLAPSGFKTLAKLRELAASCPPHE